MMTRLATRDRLFWIIVALQLLVLVGLVTMKERTLASGTTVMLKTHPVDPVDVVRGNYVALTYDISSVQVEDPVKVGETVFVALYGGADGANTGTRAFTSTRDIPDGQIFIQGTVEQASGSSATVRYGIETYYAPTERAQAIERELADGALALVALDENGRPSLCSVEGSSNWDSSQGSRSSGCRGSF